MADTGKWFVNILVISIISAIIYGLVGWGYDTVVGMSAIWGTVLGLVFTVVMLMAAKAFNPGKEFFLYQQYSSIQNHPCFFIAKINSKT